MKSCGPWWKPWKNRLQTSMIQTVGHHVANSGVRFGVISPQLPGKTDQSHLASWPVWNPWTERQYMESGKKKFWQFQHLCASLGDGGKDGGRQGPPIEPRAAGSGSKSSNILVWQDVRGSCRQLWNDRHHHHHPHHHPHPHPHPHHAPTHPHHAPTHPHHAPTHPRLQPEPVQKTSPTHQARFHHYSYSSFPRGNGSNLDTMQARRRIHST